MRAYLDELADRCPGCGQPREESMDPRGQMERLYEAKLYVCYGCVTAQGKLRERANSALSMDGVRASLTRLL